VVNLTKEKVLIRISDDGEGIEKQNIPRLLSVFYRVNKVVRDQKEVLDWQL
jgi:two-component system phosphate regulon sensor histidine kinase PhoR